MSINLTERFVSLVERMHDRMVTDLLAVSEEKRNLSPGSVARTPLSVTAECAMINGWIAARLVDKPMQPRPSAEERTAFLETFVDAEKTLAFLKTETDALIAAMSAIDPDAWDVTLELFPGRPAMARFDAATLAIGHMSYHDGQLNYIHMLYGDAEIHWK